MNWSRISHENTLEDDGTIATFEYTSQQSL